MRTAVLTFLALAIFGAVPSFAAPDFTWQVVKYDGRDYVTFESMAQFYGLTGMKREGGAATLSIGTRSLRGQAGSVEFFINNLKFNLSYPVADVSGHLCVSRMDLVKVIEPVLRPSKIKGAELVDTIILDPGHGGHDNGAMSAYGNEKTFTLDVANRVRGLLLQAGLKVFMTRSTDVFIPLEERVQFANKFPNGLFISIHFNSGGNGTGLETYTLAPRGVPSMMADGPRIGDLQVCNGNACDAENMALATATHAALVVHSKMYDRGIKRARFVVIRDISIPGVLIEGGFLSNPFDARLIAMPEYRQQMALSIYQAVMMYRKAVGPQQNEFAAKIPASPPITFRTNGPTTDGPRVQIPRSNTAPSEAPAAVEQKPEARVEQKPEARVEQKPEASAN